MKKSLVFALWCGLCVCASAAFQYEVVEGPSYDKWKPGPDNRVYGPSFTVKITGGTGSIYVLDKINNLYSMPGNTELLSIKADMSPGNYGYVEMDGTVGYGDGTTITTYNEAKGVYNDVITQTGYKIGDFNEGDEIGIWLTDVNGNKGASTLDKASPVNSEAMNNRHYQDSKDALENYVYRFDYSPSGYIPFGIHGVGATPPSGKPLPGVFATLLLGGGALGVLGMKKKRTVKA